MSIGKVGEIVNANVYCAAPQRFFNNFVFLVSAMIAVIVYCMLSATAASTQSGEAIGSVRPCKTSETSGQSKPSSAKNKKNQKPLSADLPGACVEIHADALQIQEYLQAWVRGVQWKVSDEHTNESSWDFSRQLRVDELLNFTKPERRPPGIEWQSGSTVIQITTNTIDDGFARTVIRAQYRGIGENKDKFATQRAWYRLESNGSLESSMMDALKKHFAAPVH